MITVLAAPAFEVSENVLLGGGKSGCHFMRGFHLSKVLLLASPLILLGTFFLYTFWDPALCRGNRRACVLGGLFLVQSC